MVTVAIANSFWYNKNITIKDTFIQTNQQYFDAVAQGVDFSSQETAGIINKWVYDKTRGTIPSIIEHVSSDIISIILNAVYFKCRWLEPFETKNTKSELFQKNDIATVSCNMMHLKGALKTCSNKLYNAVELAFGSSYNEYSMVLLLPLNPYSVDSLINNFTVTEWNTLTSTLSDSNKISNIALPRFKINFDAKLNDVLIASGMEIAFNNSKADFSAITEDCKTWISLVKHKTFVTVDESGIEAAGVTAVQLAGAVATREFKFDRPFIFIIKEKSSNVILFIGKVADPSLQ